jgi:hypothetical protein
LNKRWEVLMSEQVSTWLEVQPRSTRKRVDELLLILRLVGPQLGRPTVDSITGSSIHNLKELRVSSTRKEAPRILFCFTKERVALLLVAGDKAHNWSDWYGRAIQQAEEQYEQFLED